jgi:hypothetical protein
LAEAALVVGEVGGVGGRRVGELKGRGRGGGGGGGGKGTSEEVFGGVVRAHDRQEAGRGVALEETQSVLESDCRDGSAPDGSVWRGRGSHFRVPTVSPDPPPPPPPPLYCHPLEENEEEEENNKRRSKQVCDARSFTDNLH